MSIHITSTPIGDASENKAIKEMFADNLLISTPKSAIYWAHACSMWLS